MTNSISKNLYFPHINILRAFAALSVLIYHVIELYPWTAFPITPSIVLWFRTGWMGVDLFFVISGFVIMLSAIKIQASEKEDTPRVTFIKRRIVRIVPLYILTAVMFVIIGSPEILHIENFGFHALTHLFFIHNLFPTTHGSINGPNWSVGVEFQFYIFVLIFMKVLKRIPPTVLMIGGIIIAIASRAIVFMIAENNQWDVFHRFMYTTQVITMMDEFCFGMLIARIVTHSKNTLLVETQNFWKSKKFWSVLILTIIMFRLTLFIYWSRSEYWNDPFMVIAWRTLLGASFALLIATTILLPARGIFFQKNMFYRTANYLGEISYGIYLWHLPVLLFLKRKGFEDPVDFTIVLITCVIILSIFSWHGFEKRIVQRFK